MEKYPERYRRRVTSSRVGKRRKHLKIVSSSATVLGALLDIHVPESCKSKACYVSQFDHSECMKVQVKLLAGPVTALTTAMIDSGATNNFINQTLVEELSLPTQPRPFTMPVKDIAGRQLGVVDKQVKIKIKMANHEEELLLNVIGTGKHPIVLGLPWLKTHNPTIIWPESRFIFTSTHCADNCLEQSPDVFMEQQIPNITDEEADIFCVNAEINKADAKTTFSIAIGRKNIEPEKTFEELVSKEYHNFKDIFSEEVATKLPSSREYDLAITFKKDAKLPKPAEIYLMLDAKLKDLKKWTEEMLKKEFI